MPGMLWFMVLQSWTRLSDGGGDARKDHRRDEKGMKEDEMVGWHHQHNRHGFG